MSKRIKGITIELDGETKGLDKALSDVNKRSRDLQKELKDVDRLLKFNPGNADLIAQKQKLLGEQVQVTKEKLKQLQDAQKDVDKAFAEGKINEEQYRAFQRELAATEGQLKSLQGQLGTTKSSLKEIGDSAIKTGESFKKVGDGISSAGKDLTKKVTVPLMGVGAAAVLVGANFEQSMSNVAAISGATGKEFKLLEDKAIEMGGSTNKSASEAADAMSYMALAGWNTQQMIGGIEPILKLSSAGNIDLARTSDLVTDSMAALQLEVSDLPNFLDMVAKASQKSNTDIDKLMEAFLVAGGTMSSFNVPLEEATAILGIMANRGYKGSEAGTALNAIFTNLTSQTGQAADALDEWGIKAFDAEGNFKGLENVLMEIKDKTATMTDEQKANFIAMVAGKEHLKTFNGILAGLGNEYGDLKGEVSNATGALQRMYDVMTDNTKGRWDEFTSSLEKAGIAIFKNLQPALEKLLGFLQKLVDAFNNMSPSMQNTMVVLGGIAAAIGPVLVVLGVLISSIGTIIGTFGTFASAIATATAGAAAATPAVSALASVITFLTGPIGIAIAAIVAIGAALVVAYNKVDWFREGVHSVFNAVKDVVTNAMGAVVDFLSDKLSYIKTFWTENGQQIRQATENVWNAIKAVITAVMPAIQAVIKAAWFVIQTIVMSVWENIKGVISGALDVILGLVKTFSSLFTGDWQGMWEGIKQLFSGATELLWNAVQLMLWGRLLKGIAVFAGSFKTAVGTMWTSIRTVFTNAINAIKSFFTGGFEAMKSVANLSMSNIRTVVTTIWNAIKTVFSTVINTIKSVVSNGFSGMVTSIRNLMTNAVSAVRTKMSDMVNAVKDKAMSFVEAGKDLIRGLINGIKEMTASAISAVTGVVDGIVEKTKSLLKIASPSKVMEALGKWTGMGLAKGIENTIAINEKAVQDLSNVIIAEAKKGAQNVSKISEDAEKKRKEIKADYAKKIAEVERKSAQTIETILRTSKNKKGQISDSGNQRMLNNRRDTAAKLTKLAEEEQAKLQKLNEKTQSDIAKVQNQAAKDRLEAIKLFVEDKKSLEQLSLVDEAIIWQTAVEVFKDGTKQKVEAQKAYAKALDDVNKEITTINTNYATKMQDINDRLRKQEDELTKEYEKSLGDRMKSLINFASLFDKFDVRVEKSGAELLDNLKSQVDGFKKWQAEIEKLAKRAIDDGLIAELREMGPKALPELLALNSLTDKQLTEYSQLYKAKTALARQQAESELIGMKSDTEKRIDELRSTANTELSKLQKDWVSEIRGITNNTSQELKALDQIGKDAVQGLINGMKSMHPELKETADSIADAVSGTIKDSLKIKSPSRVMAEIGKWTVEGFVKGINSMSNVPSKVIEGIGKTVLDTTKSFADSLSSVWFDVDRQTEAWGRSYLNTANSLQLTKEQELDKLKEKYRDQDLKNNELYERERNTIIQKYDKERQYYLEQYNKVREGAIRDHYDQLQLYENIMHVDSFNALKSYLEKSREANEISALDEMRIWQTATDLFKDNSIERGQAIDQFADAHQRALEQIKIKNEELRVQEAAITAEYTKAVDDRTKAIASFASLFDEFKVKQEISGQDLMNNLQSQIDGFKLWADSIASLSSRAIDDGLLAELKAMGPKAAGELAALNALTDAQLEEYSKLYREKQALAREQAEVELVGMKSDTEKRIQDMRDAVQAELDEINNVWNSYSAQTVRETDDEFKKLVDVGKNAGQNLLDGLASMEGALVSKAKSIASAVSNALNSVSMPSMDITIPSAPNIPGSNSGAGGARQAGQPAGTTINQVVHINQPVESPSEVARRMQQVDRQMAMEWGFA